MTKTDKVQTVTVVNSADGLMHVHKAGCRDLVKEIKQSNGKFDLFDLTAQSREEIVREIWSDFIDEWAEDISRGWEATKFYPCVSVR